MTYLRFAAIVAATVTIVLNVRHGFESGATTDYAVLLATLNGALDMAKCSLISAAVIAWRARARFIAVLCLLLFPFLFAYSVLNAVNQVVHTREAATADTTAEAQTRARADATHRRLTSELGLAQAHPNFATTGSCTLPKSNDAKTFCANVTKLKGDIADAETTLITITPTNPNPQLTFIQSLIPTVPVATVAFAIAIVPVVLAELVGSLGFVIAAAATPDPAQEQPAKASQKAPGRLARPLWARTAKTKTNASADRSGSDNALSSSAAASAPKSSVSWKMASGAKPP